MILDYKYINVYLKKSQGNPSILKETDHLTGADISWKSQRLSLFHNLISSLHLKIRGFSKNHTSKSEFWLLSFSLFTGNTVDKILMWH